MWMDGGQAWNDRGDAKLLQANLRHFSMRGAHTHVDYEGYDTASETALSSSHAAN